MNLLKQAQQVYRVRKAWLGEGGNPVSSDVAQRRADICLECPQHDPDSPREEQLKRVVAKRIFRVKQQLGLRVERENDLHLCGLCGCLLDIKVHIPLDIAREGTPDWHQFPKNCWLRAEKTSNDTFDNSTG